MRFILLFIIFLPYLSHAEWDQFFSDNDDPAVAHHVNVITGHLHFSFQDAIAEGAISIPLTRTYSSAGALESESSQTFLAMARSGWMLQGGWNLISHVNLLIIPHEERKQFTAYLAEPGGGFLAYKYSHKKEDEKHTIFLKPKRFTQQACGQLSARNCSYNNLLQINLKTGEAIVFLPDGGQRIYRGNSLHHYSSKQDLLKKNFYLLDLEILPSQHRYRYFYDNGRNLQSIEATNPKGNKIYSKISFDYFAGDNKTPFSLNIKTSDEKEILYKSGRYKNQNYLDSVYFNFRPSEKAHLVCERRGTEPRLTSLDLGGQRQFQIQYYCPKDKEHEKKWAEYPEKKHFYVDKVQAVYGPVSPDGKQVPIATFTYGRELTTMRDTDGLLTEYHHDGERLHQICYFDEQDQCILRQQLYWNGIHLRSKAMFDANWHPLFAKTFSYDGDNIIEEVLWGDLTGEGFSSPQAPCSPYHSQIKRFLVHDKMKSFFIDRLGRPSGSPSIRKKFSYYKDNWNLLQRIEEEDGPIYEYSYKDGTNLISSKLTKDHCGKILIREFFFYDEDNFLIKELTDNGISADSNDLNYVTQRLQKDTHRNTDSGLPEIITESYWDSIASEQKLLKKIKLKYSSQKLIEEAIYDADDVYRYTIHTAYDSFGHIKSRTTPLGQENTYQYNHLGLLEKSKKVGSSAKIYKYDAANRLIHSIETDTGKTTSASYNAKDEVLFQTDERGNTTHHQYDRQGNRIITIFPKTRDEHGQIQEPIATFCYNHQRDLISSTMPLQGTTRTTYNLFRKPIHIIQADGTSIFHTYNKNGALAQTIHPDGTQERYEYDLFQRMIAKTTFDSSGEVLSHESWEYSAFQLCAHTDPSGLTTHFFYDGAGRKISEQAENRKVTLKYDALGFVERTNNGSITHIQKHNASGLIEEEWQEDSTGLIENRMRFVYDSEFHKIAALRWTSQGEAKDQLEYQNHKLTKHIDPLGAVTVFFYNEEYLNDLGQKVLQKTTINPLGHATIDTFDAGGRLSTQEKKDAQGRTVFKEEFHYDLAGNRAKRISYVYKDGNLQKMIPIFWIHDSMGRIIETIEPNQKITKYEYDPRGRLITQTLPNGVQCYYSYDGLGRLLTQRTSDGVVHDEYRYGTGTNPIQIVDQVHGITIKRSYNRFGELIQESNTHGLTMQWAYDSCGRSIITTLPDSSSIRYQYSGAHLQSVQRYSPDNQIFYEHFYDLFDANGHVAEERMIHNLGQVQTVYDQLERPSQQNSAWLSQSIAYGPSSLVISTQNSLHGPKNYAYDPLDQLIEEGTSTYQFDSLGNPTTHEVNDLNQIVATEQGPILYDPNGHPCERICNDTKIAYTFDPRGRLTEIIYSSDKKVCYIYDPLSRLFAKETYRSIQDNWELEDKRYYLYDKDKEIGTFDEKGKIQELKVLGLALAGDIGAAVALELQGEIFAPLHDFNGHVIAIIGRNGQIAEHYAFEAFGKEHTTSPPKNPWRFCSKRSDENLIFFGLRFYDASLGRWLSPDPSGFADGPNLYAYLRNSPMNRLDLFGLFGDEKFPIFKPTEIFLPILSLPMDNRLVLCKAMEGGVQTDYLISCGHWHQLQFTPQERATKVFNLFEHKELMPVAGQINLVTFGNGINNSYSEFYDTCDSIVLQLPGTLFIGRYQRTEGISTDAMKAGREIFNVETIDVCKNRQFLLTCSHSLQKLNPAVFDSSGALQAFGALWAHFDHSRGGVMDLRALQGMTYEQKQTLQTQLLMTCVAPALPIPESYALKVVNFYSSQDFVTGGLGTPDRALALLGGLIPHKAGLAGALINKYCFDRSDCDIRIVPCVSKWSERSFGLADHAMLGGTYRKVVTEAIGDYQKRYGIFNGKIR